MLPQAGQDTAMSATHMLHLDRTCANVSFRESSDLSGAGSSGGSKSMANTSRRLVARSTDVSDIVNAYRFLGVSEALREARNELWESFGLSLPAIEPEYHVFPERTRTVSTSMTGALASAAVDVLRCVVEIERDSFTAHGSEARPVILVQVGGSCKGWSSPPDGSYDAVVCATESQIKHLLIDLFLDFTLSSAPHLRYIFEGYISKFGFGEFAKRKVEFAKQRGLANSRFGAIAPDIRYVNFSSLTGVGGVRELGALVSLWEDFALSHAFRDFATIESAVVSLSNRKRVGGQLQASDLRETCSSLSAGVYGLIIFTPKLQSARKLASEVGSAFLMKAPARNRTSVMAAADLWVGPYRKARKKLFREEYVKVERFIIQP